ncbi:MAG: 7TM diverse intracellular signaling domain-containing protein [Campylobacterota bacterium]
MRLFWFVLLLVLSAFADDAVSVSGQGAKIDGFSIGYFEDSGEGLGFERVMQQEFKPVSNRFSFGYRSHPIWLKVTLRNITDSTQSFVLAFEEPFLQTVDLYYQKNGRTHMQQNGTNIPLAKRKLPHTNAHFPLSLKPKAQQTYYLKLETEFATFGELFVYESGYYRAGAQRSYFLYFLYLGAVAAIGLYNIFLYFGLKNRSHLYYAGYSLGFGTWVALYSGVAYLYIPVAHIHAYHVYAPLTFVFFILFSNYILKVDKNFPRLFTLSKANMVLLLVLVVVMLFDLGTGFGLLNAVASYLFLLYFGIASVLAYRGDRVALYYLLAIGIFLLTMSMAALLAMGLLPNTIFTRYSFLVGSFIEIVVFSFLLAFRISNTQKQYQQTLHKEIARQTKDIEDKNKKLHEAVAQKERLLKEMFHRVKNNFQVLIAILSLQQQEEASKTLRAKMEFLIQKLQAMAQIHAMLFNIRADQTIDAGYFVTKLCDHLRTDWITVDTQLESFAIKGADAQNLGLILNELFANSFKHSCLKNSCFISLKLYKKGPRALLCYRDSAACYDADAAGEGTGTELIEEFATKLPNASVAIERGRVLQYVISFDL